MYLSYKKLEQYEVCKVKNKSFPHVSSTPCLYFLDSNTVSSVLLHTFFVVYTDIYPDLFFFTQCNRVRVHFEGLR